MSNQQNYSSESAEFRRPELFNLQPQTPGLFEGAHGHFMANEASKGAHRLQYGIDEALGFDEFDWSQVTKKHPDELDPWRPIGQR
jgi:hypothetical protein